VRLFFLLLLLMTSPLVAGAEWLVSTPTVYNGELAMLRWDGATPPRIMVGSFLGKKFYSEQTSLGPVALLAVDIETPNGQVPIQLVSVGPDGAAQPQTLHLEVRQKDRGVSRITLPPEMVTPKGAALLARISAERALLAEIFANDSGPLFADLFRRPVPDKLNSPFGKKRVLNGLPRAPHSGADFKSPLGRLIRSPAKGDVVFNGDLYYTGRTVVLNHGAGLYSLYAHLSKSLCAVGQRLDPGQPLGKVGSTGRSTGAHLHWTIRLRETRIDPISVLDLFGSKIP
jgi:murein DD-endopeptidase MepM/ murein hydrolase activator NlpD